MRLKISFHKHFNLIIKDDFELHYVLACSDMNSRANLAGEYNVSYSESFRILYMQPLINLICTNHYTKQTKYLILTTANHQFNSTDHCCAFPLGGSIQFSKIKVFNTLTCSNYAFLELIQQILRFLYI